MSRKVRAMLLHTKLTDIRHNLMYRVNEIFYSLQGEGFHTGTPCVFIRFSGCNRVCPFCDTDFAAYTTMSVDEILEAVCRYPSRRVVCTGGEPLLQLDDCLVERLHFAGFTIAVETNGSLQVPLGVDWVTCSPKPPHLAIDRIDELKVLFDGSDPEKIKELLPPSRHHFLQPVSCSNTAEVVDYILHHPHWRLSLQTHKLIDIP